MSVILAASPSSEVRRPGRARRPLRRHALRVLLYAVLTTLAALYLTPFLWMISTSLKGPTEYLRAGINLLPENFRWSNYVEVFERVPFATFYWNTVVVTVIRVVAQIALAATAGYAFARFRFRARTLLFIAVLVILMIPPPVTLVPNFVIIRQLGWVNTYTGLVVPTIFSAFGVFLFRQFFLTLPKDLIDAAKLDGCRPWRVFWHIGLPAARAHIAAFGLLVALYSWNEFLWSLVAATDNSRRVISVGIFLFSTGYRQEWGLMMAAATTSVVPLLVVFAIAQKHLIRGITLTGLKA
jgi:multiple sugar transport system permease protein